MSIAIQVENISIKTKEDLKELIAKVGYTPSVFDSQYEHVSLVPDSNKGDAIIWDLMDILIDDYFEGYLGLRRKDPNLQERFDKLVDFFNRKQKEFQKTYDALDAMQEKEAR